MLADHPAIDMLVNNAGRSIRRSVKLSYDRFHDYERTVGLNYLSPVKLMLGLLPHMTERGSGHIVNVSSIGVQTNPPRFSAYVASKSALDAFTRVVSSETIGDNVTFTTIHMPLVRTPMIAPTKIYDSFPTISPDEAADLICEAIRAKPKQINTRLGHVRRGRLRAGAEGGRPDPAHGLQGVPRVGRRERQEGPERAGLRRGAGARVPDARRALVTDDHVTVTGTAQRAVAPGAATWRAEAVEADDDPRAAFERCSSRLNALVERLDGLGEVATEAVVVQPRWEERGQARRRGDRRGARARRGRAAPATSRRRRWRPAPTGCTARASSTTTPTGCAASCSPRRSPTRAARPSAWPRRAGAGSGRCGRSRSPARSARRPYGALAAAAAEAPDVRPRELTVTARGHRDGSRSTD